MKRALIILSLLVVPSCALAGQAPIAVSTSDRCGAGHRGCVPQLVREFMHVGYTLLPETSSATVSEYAHACASRPDWRQQCFADPAAVLSRLGLTPED
ncbi:hypothetical protein [Mesorhizobium sp. M0276]|uniref:hypothetical protein n=1 Tax=Mesorhizobium sp. M0276 TaxID=2956928 RepID=UPI00333A828B